MILLFVNFNGLYSQNPESNSIPIDTAKSAEKPYYTIKEIGVSKIFTLAYPLEEYESMIIRCNELSYVLLEHKERIDDGSITKSQIKDLKRDLVEAKLLHFRLSDFTQMYHKLNYPVLEYLSEETLSNYQVFSKILLNTTQYAGF